MRFTRAKGQRTRRFGKLGLNEIGQLRQRLQPAEVVHLDQHHLRQHPRPDRKVEETFDEIPLNPVYQRIIKRAIGWIWRSARCYVDDRLFGATFSTPPGIE